MKTLSPRIMSPQRPKHRLPNAGSEEYDEQILEDSKFEPLNYDLHGEIESEVVTVMEAMTANSEEEKVGACNSRNTNSRKCALELLVGCAGTQMVAFYQLLKLALLVARSEARTSRYE